MVILHQDSTITITETAVIYRGEKIPITSISKVEFRSNRSWFNVNTWILNYFPFGESLIPDYETHITVNLVIKLPFFQTRIIGSAHYAPNLFWAALSLGRKFRKQRHIQQILNLCDATTSQDDSDKLIAKLRSEPTVNQNCLEQLLGIVSKYQRLKKIEAAICQAMTY